ncbi:MAG: hypothetical protein J6C42_10065, partial [Clostridia bacterium]|nr:hypothetical protein [Clostridia bacterium]
MEFFCGTGFTRPVRLCEETRRFAYESLHGKYGDDAKTTPHVSVDNIYGFDDMLDYERYTCCIDAIVRECPLRFVEGERIIGAATLGAAIGHVVPAVRNGSYAFGSVGIPFFNLRFYCFFAYSPLPIAFLPQLHSLFVTFYN